MNVERDRHDEEREHIAGESLDELKRSVDAFLHGEAKPRGRVVDAAYRKRMHAALDDLLGRLKQKRTCAGDRQFSKRMGVRP